jgi:hypothetical protein
MKSKRVAIIAIWLLISACNDKTYPEKYFEFSFSSRQLFNSFDKTDTFYIQNEKNGIDTFVLPIRDSVFHNKKNSFINFRPSKTLSIKYKQIPINFWRESWYEHSGTQDEKEVQGDATLISITKFPDSRLTEIYISFKNFRYTLKDDLLPISDSIQLNNKWHNNYYKLKTTAPALCQDSGDIETLFIGVNDGIIGYKEKSGAFRSRIE